MCVCVCVRALSLMFKKARGLVVSAFASSSNRHKKLVFTASLLDVQH